MPVHGSPARTAAPWQLALPPSTGAKSAPNPGAESHVALQAGQGGPQAVPWPAAEVEPGGARLRRRRQHLCHPVADIGTGAAAGEFLSQWQAPPCPGCAATVRKPCHSSRRARSSLPNRGRWSPADSAPMAARCRAGPPIFPMAASVPGGDLQRALTPEIAEPFFAGLASNERSWHRRTAIVVFLAFAFAYFFSALLRAITATLSPTLTREFALNAQRPGAAGRRLFHRLCRHAAAAGNLARPPRAQEGDPRLPVAGGGRLPGLFCRDQLLGPAGRAGAVRRRASAPA